MCFAGRDSVQIAFSVETAAEGRERREEDISDGGKNGVRAPQTRD